MALFMWRAAIGNVVFGKCGRGPLARVRFNRHGELKVSLRPLSTSSHGMQHAKADKKLFTPGPLGVSMTTKQAMLRDLGSRDTEFINLVKDIRGRLLGLAGVSSSEYTAVPVQGSGTFSLEAVLTTVMPRDTGKILILENGAYGRRQATMCDVLNIPYQLESFQENQPVDGARAVEILLADPSITAVSVVHCETSSGIMNSVEEIGQAVKGVRSDITYFVDAMSSFGAVPLDMVRGHVDYMVSSANKCIEGVPGFAYAICRISHLLSCKGQARSYSLDLVDQYEGLEANGQFRFTPPIHAMLAFKQALDELRDEGGVTGRGARYTSMRNILRDGMKKLGFKEYLDPAHAGPIISSYYYPNDPNFNFNQFYNKLNKKDQVIYPGKLLKADCFRIGSVGHLFPSDMEHLVKCIQETLQEMNVKIPIQ